MNSEINIRLHEKNKSKRDGPDNQSGSKSLDCGLVHNIFDKAVIETNCLKLEMIENLGAMENCTMQILDDDNSIINILGILYTYCRTVGLN